MRAYLRAASRDAFSLLAADTQMRNQQAANIERQTSSADHLAAREDQRSGFRLANAHDDGRKALHACSDSHQASKRTRACLRIELRVASLHGDLLEVEFATQTARGYDVSATSSSDMWCAESSAVTGSSARCLRTDTRMSCQAQQNRGNQTNPKDASRDQPGPGRRCVTQHCKCECKKLAAIAVRIDGKSGKRLWIEER